MILSLIWLLHILFAAIMIDADGGEGCWPATGSAGLFTEGNLCGRRPREASGPNANSDRSNKMTTAKKRSYRRAVRRVSQHGYTWYRNRILATQDIPKHHRSTTKTSCFDDSPHIAVDIPHSCTPSQQKQHQRMTLFSWNAGGLTQSSWDNLQMWLSKQDISVVFVQESKWKHCSEWLSPAYTCIHSAATPTKSGGLLTLVSRRLIGQQLISWHEIIPGRLVHVRLHFSSRSVDLLHCYQHVWRLDNAEAREHYIQTLSSTLTRIPRRNLLYMAGDFNTTIPCSSEVIGNGSFMHCGQLHTGSTHQDWMQLHDLCRAQGLVALNTFDVQLGGTFIFPEGMSRIDYIFSRQTHLDHHARQIAYLHNFPLLPHTGSFHLPLLTTVRKQWQHYAQKGSHKWTYARRMGMADHWKWNTEYWQQCSEHITHCFQRKIQSPVDSSKQLHDDINMTIKPTSTQQAPGVPFGSVSLFADFCQCTSQIRKTALVNLGSHQLFRLWKLVTTRRRLQKLMTKHSREARKNRLRDIMQKAQDAANAKDQYELYQCIRKLAPKQIYKRIQLRNAAGEILSPTESAEFIADWWQQVYLGPELDFDTNITSWPFTISDVHKTFASFDARKALDHHYAPSVIWKTHPKLASQMLTRHAEHWVQQGALPDDWSSASIVFIPKVGKPMNDPSSLRPIALLEPLSKSVMGTLCHYLQRETLDSLIRYPQMAYLHRRGCAEALLRVQRHCQQVREMKFHHQYRIHQQAHGIEQSSLRGGLLISLDLTRAFDSVNRNDLIRALHHFRVSPELINLVCHIYRSTLFSFEHRGTEKQFRATRGIRQGCKSAPMLWSLFVAWILDQYAAITTPSWLTDNNTVYADDWTVYDLFNDPFENCR